MYVESPSSFSADDVLHGPPDDIWWKKGIRETLVSLGGRLST
jgi:hypothetical protein